MLLLRSCYPSGQVKRAMLVFICQSQLPFISGSNLTAREPFSITEHWKPADPQSRPPYMLHSHSVSAHPNSWIKRHHAFTGCIHHLERLRLRSVCWAITLQATGNPSCFHSDLHVRTSPLSSSFCALIRNLNSTHTHPFFFPGQCLLHVDTGSQFIYF